MAVPFVLHSQPNSIFEPGKVSMENEATVAQRRYVEIMRDVEALINDHSTYQVTIGNIYLLTTRSCPSSRRHTR